MPRDSANMSSRRLKFEQDRRNSGSRTINLSTAIRLRCRALVRMGSKMRRRLGFFIPIVILAALVQFFAPIAAFRAFASAVSDPLYFATICADQGSAQDSSQTAPANSRHHSGGCCVACAIGHAGGVAIESPPIIFVALQRQYQLVSWLEADRSMPPLRTGSNAQARAPPAIS